MISPVDFVLLYPYPYQTFAVFVSFLFLVSMGLIAFGLYKLIAWKMGVGLKKAFQGFLLILCFSLAVLFFAELTLSVITIFQVNKQLGFSYATPETPEGELFEISGVEPGKTMDKSGLKIADRVQMAACKDLYLLLINNQGKEAVIPIIRNKQELQIKVNVPNLDVPLARVSFLF
jgi:hypothetical protein